MGYTLITGATGLLGGYLLRDLLAADTPVAVVVRASQRRQARERVEDVLVPFERMAGRSFPRPFVLSGDISAPQCGLDEPSREWLRRHCDQILHSAASLAFVEDGSEPRQTNVDGTRNILELCRQIGVRHLAHVSTAYVCGKATGVFYEHELDHAFGYGNVYEETKAEAERLIHNAGLDGWTIFRPSIIAGDSRTGFTSSFHGFYTPLRILQSLQRLVTTEQAFSASYLGSLGLAGNERKNLVPVDWVSDAIVKILDRQSCKGRTYALTSDHPVTVDELREAFADALLEHIGSSERTGFASNAAMTTKAFEGEFREQFQIYKSYWRDDCLFDRANSREILPDTPCPELTRDVLVRLSRYALNVNFGYPKPPPESCDFWVEGWLGRLSEPDTLRACEGTPFNLVATGPGGGRWMMECKSDREARWMAGHAHGAPEFRTSTRNLARVATQELTLTNLVEAGLAASSWPTSFVERFDARYLPESSPCRTQVGFASAPRALSHDMS